eukprot:6172863-Pleurochrysis_carterae.AAC.3
MLALYCTHEFPLGPFFTRKRLTLLLRAHRSSRRRAGRARARDSSRGNDTARSRRTSSDLHKRTRT